MATYHIPKNAGKFQVVVASGGHFAVWNGKHGRNEVSIPVKTKKQAKEICAKINSGQHDGTIEVLS
jgi:hypothetical protein